MVLFKLFKPLSGSIQLKLLALLGWQNAFMNCWWFLVHCYCWTCGFRGPLGAQGAVGCPLATTHVNHFLRGFVGVDFLGVEFLGVNFVRHGCLGVDFLGVDFGMDYFSTTKPPNRCGRMHQQIHVFVVHPKIHPQKNNKIHPLLLSGPATAAAVTFHSHVRTIGCRAP